MITAKKSKAWIVLIVLGVFFLLLGILVGDEALGVMMVLAIVCLVIGLIVMAVSSKNYKKKSAWIAEANADGTIDRINNSISNGSATYFKSLKLALTSTELVENSNTPFIIKYEDIANVYRSNIREGKYDYTYQYIRIDLKNGQTVYVATVTRARVPAEFGNAIGTIKSHLNAEGGF
ncbi:MAG: hypothetical protein IKR39_08080 [Lachnospiraceae bacterium]|nr:hypothetical protein [Lachnospiraceae bacterium]